jgi:hypothetical protein
VHNRPRLVSATVFALAAALTGYGQEVGPAPQPVTISNSTAPEQSLTFWPSSIWRPMLQFMSWLFEPVPALDETEPVSMTQPKSLGVCAVAPLDPIEDPAAQQLEASTGSEVVDVQHMVPAAARALDRFESKVQGVGGTIVLKSAYRPAPYQKHLQNVWYKWMGELRNNSDPACQGLRAQVQAEFTRHRLIETQHPVAVSDHTRGLAFDATVDLPPHAAVGRRRLTLDGLAHLAGLLRPAIAADPVHFKFFGGVRTVALRRRRNA